MEDIAYNDGYAAQYGDNYGYDGYGYGGDLGAGDYNPYGTDYGYDAGGYEYGASYGGYDDQGAGYGDYGSGYGEQAHGYGEPIGQQHDAQPFKLEEPKISHEPEHEEAPAEHADRTSTSMDPFSAPVDVIADLTGSQIRTSSAFPPVSQDLLNSIKAQQETSGNLSKSPSKMLSRPASARLDDLDKIREEDIKRPMAKNEARTVPVDAGASADDMFGFSEPAAKLAATMEPTATGADDMFGFTEHPAEQQAAAVTTEPSATGEDDMFGFGPETTTIQDPATTQPATEDTAATPPDTEVPSAGDEDDMFGFTASAQETAMLPTDSVPPITEPADDMFGFTEQPAEQPAVAATTIEPTTDDGVAAEDEMFGFTSPPAELAATAEPTTAEGDDMFGFGPSEATIKESDTAAPEKTESTMADAQGSAGDMFGFGEPEAATKDASKSIDVRPAPLVVDLEEDSMFGFDSPAAPIDSAGTDTAAPADTSADDLFGFGTGTSEPQKESAPDNQGTEQPPEDSMFGFDLQSEAIATAEPLATDLATKEPEVAPADEMFGFASDDATDKPDADQEITLVVTKTIDEPTIPSGDEEQLTAGPSDDMFGFDNSADALQTNSVPHSGATADDMFGFDSAPATEKPEQELKPKDASPEHVFLDMPAIPEHMPTMREDLTELSPEDTADENKLADERLEQLEDIAEEPEADEQPAHESAAEDMFGFGDAPIPAEQPSKKRSVEGVHTELPDAENPPPPVSASSLLPVQASEPARKPVKVVDSPAVNTAIDIDSMISAALVPQPPTPPPEEKVEEQVPDESQPIATITETLPVVEEETPEELNEEPATEPQAVSTEEHSLAKDDEFTVQESLPAEEDTQDVPAEPPVPTEILERLAINETFVKLQEELQSTYQMPEPNQEELDKLQMVDHEQQLIQLKDEAERLLKENRALAGRSAVPRHLPANEFDSKSISVSFFEGLLNEPTHSEGISLTTGEELRLLAILEQGDYDALDTLHGMSPEELQLMEQREREFNMKLKELTDRRDELLCRDDTEALKLIEEEIWAFVDAEEEKKMRIKAADDLRKKRAQEEEDRRRAEIEKRIKEEQDRVAEERRLHEEMIALQKKQQQEYDEQEARKAELLREAMEKEQLARIEEEQRLKAEAKKRLLDELEATAERAAAEDRIRVKAELEEMARIKKELEEAARTASEEKRKLLLQQKEQLEKEMAETAKRHEEDVARRQRELEALHEERRKMREQRLASAEPMNELLRDGDNDASDPFSYASLDLERRIKEMRAQLEQEMAEKMALEHADLSALERELATRKLSTMQAERLLDTAAHNTRTRLDHEDRLFDEAMDAKRQELRLLEEQYGTMRQHNESQRALQLEEQAKAKKLAGLTAQISELTEEKRTLERKIAHGNKVFHKKESKLVASNSKGALKALRKEHAKECETLEAKLAGVSEHLHKLKKQLKALQASEEVQSADRSLSVKDYLRSADKEHDMFNETEASSYPRLSVIEGTALGQPSLVSGYGVRTTMSTADADYPRGLKKQHASSDLPAALQKLREEHARRLEKIEQRRAAFASEREQLQAQTSALAAQLSKPVNVPDARLRTREQRKQVIFAEMNRMEKLSKVHMVDVKPQIPEKTVDEILNERRKRRGYEREQLKSMAERFTSAYDKQSRISVNMDSSDDEWNDLAAQTSSRYADLSTKPRSMQAQVRQFASDRIDPVFNSYIEAPVRPGYESSLLSYVKVSSDPTTCHPTKFVARLTSHTWCIEQRNKPYVVYTFVISTEKGVFEIAKRFSELRELDKSLRRVFPTVTLPKYPSAMGGKFTDEQLEERKRLLGRYMSQLNQIAVIRTSQVYKEFMQMKVSHDILVYHR